jgi:hypothetical protein
MGTVLPHEYSRQTCSETIVLEEEEYGDDYDYDEFSSVS